MNLHEIEHPDDQLAARAQAGYRTRRPDAEIRRHPSPGKIFEFQVRTTPQGTWAPLMRADVKYWAQRAP